MLLASAVSADPRENLQLGFAIELSVLPPYLYSLWSIKSRAEGASDAAIEAANAIRSVVYEEMLHAALAANILNALGSTPRVTAHLVHYPGPLPGHVTTGPYAYDVGLCGLSKGAVATFMRIEMPEWDVPLATQQESGWTTIPEFYAQLKWQLRALPPGAFNHGRQLPRRDNPGPGQLLSIVDYDSACQAIDIIIDQGEGHKPKSKDDVAAELDFDHEVAHYYQFQTIAGYLDAKLIDPDRDLYPVIDDPGASKYSAAQQAANREFNLRYTALLDTLQAVFSVDHPTVWGSATGLMNDLAHAAALLRACGPVPGEAHVAGPTFEYLGARSTD